MSNTTSLPDATFFEEKPNLSHNQVTDFTDRMGAKIGALEAKRKAVVFDRQLTALKSRTQTRQSSEGKGVDDYVDLSATEMFARYKSGKHLMSGTGRTDDVYSIAKNDITRESRTWRQIVDGYGAAEIELNSNYEKLIKRRRRRRVERSVRKFGLDEAEVDRREHMLHRMEATRKKYLKTGSETARLKREATEALDKVTELSEKMRAPEVQTAGFGLRARLFNELQSTRTRARTLLRSADEMSNELFNAERHFQLYGFTPYDADARTLSETTTASRGHLTDIIGQDSAFGKLQDLPENLHSLDLAAEVRAFQKEEFASLAKSVGMTVDSDGNVTAVSTKKDNAVSAAKQKLMSIVESRRNASAETSDLSLSEKKHDAEDDDVKVDSDKRRRQMHKRNWSISNKDFDGIERVGRLMVLKDRLAKREEVSKRLEAARLLDAKEAEARRRLEAKKLQSLEISGDVEASTTQSKTQTKDIERQIKRMQKQASMSLDYTIAAMGAQNIIRQRDRESTMAIFGTGAVVNVDPKMLPPLCMAWVAQQCTKGGLQCKRRHYYCSAEERERSMQWLEEMERTLERPLVRSITLREEILDKIREEIKACNRKFEGHFGSVQESDVAALISLLNQVRVITVECVERISKWVRHVQKQNATVARTAAENRAKASATSGASSPPSPPRRQGSQWSVKVVATGDILYKRSPAFRTKDKRFCRDANLERKRLRWKYLGVYPTKENAMRVYEQACRKEAVRSQLPVSLMPSPKILIRACGHCSVESNVADPTSYLKLDARTAQTELGQSACEICAVQKIDSVPDLTIPWTMSDGRNYLLKIINDLDMLADCEPLSDWLGSSFPLLRNPFMLSRSFDDTLRIYRKKEGGISNEMGTENEKMTVVANPGGSSTSPSSKIVATFGRPNDVVLRMPDGVYEWKGHANLGTSVRVGEHLAFAPFMHAGVHMRQKGSFRFNTRASIKSQMQSFEFAATAFHKRYKILTMERVQHALSIVHFEHEQYSREVTTSNGDKSTRAGTNNEESDDDDDLDQLIVALEASSDDKGDKGIELYGSPKSRWNLPMIEEERIAFFRDTYGAVLPVRQTYLKDFREQRFCYPYSGMWASLRVRGRAQRARNFTVKRELRALRRQQAREKLLRMLKSAVRRRSADRMLALMPRGEILGGKDIEIEILKAKSVLDTMERRKAKAQLMQRLWRGFKDRKAVKLMIHARNQGGAVEMQREGICRGAAKRVVARALAKGCLRAARRLMRPLHKEVRILDTEAVLMRVMSNACYDYASMSVRGAETPSTVCDARENRVAADAQNAVIDRRKNAEIAECGAADVLSTPEPGRHSRWNKNTNDSARSWRTPVLCAACRRIEQSKRLSLGTDESSYFGWRTKLDAGQCTCSFPRVPERIRVLVYNPVTKEQYIRIISEKELRKRLLNSIQNGDLKFDSLLARAARLESLPTDALLGFGTENNRPKRSRFEPLKEMMRAVDRVTTLQRRAQWYRDEANSLRERARDARTRARKCGRRLASLRDAFLVTHQNFLRGAVFKEAMKQAAADAIAFSKQQLALYEDLTKASRVNAWDPLEDASTHVFIRRKRAAILAMFRHAVRRFVAYTRLWRCSQEHRALVLAAVDAEKDSINADAAASRAESVATTARDQGDIVVQMAKNAMEHLCSILTLRTKFRGHLRRRLEWNKDAWFSPKPKVHAPVLAHEIPALNEWIDTVEPGWNVLWHHCKRLWTAPFPRKTRSSALFNIVVRWERWDSNPQRPNHVLIRAIRVTSIRSGEKNSNGIQLLITPLELRELIVYDVLGPLRPDLLSKDVVHKGTFTQRQTKMRAERVELAQILVDMLQINNFTGQFQCGKLNYFRSRRGIVRAMRGSRWWHDHIMRKRTGPGPIVFRGPHRLGKIRALITFHACDGNIVIRAYERRTSRWIDVAFSASDVRRALSDNIQMQRLWDIAVRSGKYPRRLVRFVLSRVELRRDKSRANVRSPLNCAREVVSGPAIPKRSKYCCDLDCSAGIQIPKNFVVLEEGTEGATGVRRSSHRCKLCRDKKQTLHNGWMEGYIDIAKNLSAIMSLRKAKPALGERLRAAAKSFCENISFVGKANSFEEEERLVRPAVEEIVPVFLDFREKDELWSKAYAARCSSFCDEEKFAMRKIHARRLLLLQMIVRRWRLHRFHMFVEQRRMSAYLKILQAPRREWKHMAAEDAVSTSLRPYLTMPSEEIARMRVHFDQYDTDRSGSINMSEFRHMVFDALDLALSKSEARDAMRKIDIDGSGEIGFHEFVIWHALNDDYRSLIENKTLSRRIVESSLILQAKWRDGKMFARQIKNSAKAKAAKKIADAQSAMRGKLSEEDVAKL
eukprot:g1879.t1